MPLTVVMTLTARLEGILGRGNKVTILLDGGHKLTGKLQRDAKGLYITYLYNDYKQVYYFDLAHIASIGERFEEKKD